MTTTYENAIDEIFSQINTAWRLNAADVVGVIPSIFWQGEPEGDIPDNDKFWATVVQETIAEEQTTLSTDVAVPGQSRYGNNGLLIMDIYCSLSHEKHMEFGRKLAVIARDAFRGKTTPSCIRFDNVRIKEVGPSSNRSYLFKVVVEYYYEDIG